MTALDGTRSELVRAAEELIDPERLADIVMAMAGVPSPTGEEGELARWAVDSLTGAGIEARYQPIDDDQGNAVARLRGDGTGPDQLLYAPIDTLTTGNPEEDLPRVGTALRYDMVPEPVRDGDYAIGLGASNPKGHAACLVAALEILVVDTPIANLIRESKTHQIPGMMQVGKKKGNQTLDDHIMEHLKASRISPEDAYDRSLDKKKFRVFLKQAPDDWED